MRQSMEALAARLLYKVEVVEHFPERERAFMRHCDDCVHGRSDELVMRMGCAKSHRPRFFQPKSGDFTSGQWGWMRSCRDFKYKKIVEEQKIKDLLNRGKENEQFR